MKRTAESDRHESDDDADRKTVSKRYAVLPKISVLKKPYEDMTIIFRPIDFNFYFV